MALPAQQPPSASPGCLYCGRWNPPGAQQCSNCGNLLPDAQPRALAPAQSLVPAAPSPASRPGFYRAPLRVFIMGLAGGPIYLVWWTFQLLSFERRERLQNAGNPWTILIPIYGLFVIARGIQSLHDEELRRAGRESFSVAAITAMYIGLVAIDRIAANLTGGIGLLLDVGTNVVAAAIMLAVQRSANAYLAAVHPELGPAPTNLAGRVTWGEIVALVVGSLLTLLVIAADLSPS